MEKIYGKIRDVPNHQPDMYIEVDGGFNPLIIGSSKPTVNGPFTIWLFNIAMENPRTKWWFLAGKIIYKWVIFHGYVK